MKMTRREALISSAALAGGALLNSTAKAQDELPEGHIKIEKDQSLCQLSFYTAQAGRKGS